tara:strand:+ start:9532 stop:9840 length:309 start_codon:yes stop_codon:yes gene_type:complete
MNTKTYEANCALTKYLDGLEVDKVKSYLAIGLAGEVGELLNLIKKKEFYTDYHLDYATIKDEIGDCLYYLTNLITEYGYSLDDIMEHNSKKTRSILEKKALE